jgi:cytochrome P450
VLRRPDVEARLLAEAEAALGPAAPGAPKPGYEACSGLSYGARALCGCVCMCTCAPASVCVCMCVTPQQTCRRQLLQKARSGLSLLTHVSRSNPRLTALLCPLLSSLPLPRAARAVFLEGLRLHPSVPENAKFAVRPDVLPDGTRVPAGAMLVHSAYAINRMTEFWGPDAAEFRWGPRVGPQDPLCPRPARCCGSRSCSDVCAARPHMLFATSVPPRL